jgi:hypothetical protein
MHLPPAALMKAPPHPGHHPLRPPRAPGEHLPLTTGRVALSQSHDVIEFYDRTNHVSTARVRWHPRHQRPERPDWPRPTFDCQSWSPGGCGCSMGCGGTRLFAAMLVDSRWWPTEED